MLSPAATVAGPEIEITWLREGIFLMPFLFIATFPQ
jgi:hypothetical protein